MNSNTQNAVEPGSQMSDLPAPFSLIDVGLFVVSALAVLFLLLTYFTDGNEVLSQPFWLAASRGWCVYGPLWILALFQTYVTWPGLPRRYRLARLIGLGVAACIGVFWVFASI